MEVRLHTLISPDRYGRRREIGVLSMDKKSQVGARHVARQNGSFVPSDGPRRLTDGTIITQARIDPSRDEGVVTGITKNGGHFRISVPLALAGM